MSMFQTHNNPETDQETHCSQQNHKARNTALSFQICAKLEP